MADDSLIQLDQAASDRLRALAEKERVDVAAIIDQAIARYEKALFRRDVTESFRPLREDPVAQKEYQDEIRSWDVTLLDGLENDPWTEDDGAQG